MSILNYTPEKLTVAINDAEQLSLILIMLFSQNLSNDQLYEHVEPLLVKLNSDLQDAASLNLFLQHKND